MAAASTATTFDPPEFDLDTGKGSVGYLFNRLNKKQPTSEFCQTLLKLFEAHRFVKKRRKLDFYKECDEATCSHSFEVRGFSADAYKFAKWIRTEGKQYKHIAGGVSDDGLYTLSEVRVTKIRIGAAEICTRYYEQGKCDAGTVSTNALP